MALDPNLYTLHFRPTSSPLTLTIQEEIDAEARYELTRTAADVMTLSDCLSSTALSSAQCLKPNKLWLIKLLNPDLAVELKSQSKLSWEHGFEFEAQSFVWKRDSSITGQVTGYTMYISRKPDADIACAIYKLETKHRLASLQFLDYNLHRITDIQDRRGLELIILMSLATFLDLGNHSTEDGPLSYPNAGSDHSLKQPSPESIQQRQPTPEGAPNEVSILETLTDSFLIEHCCELLKDSSLAYIILKATSASSVKKAIHVAAEVKRNQYKLNPAQELHQYVVEPSTESNVKMVFGKKAYTSPTCLQIFLSRFPLDELQPKPKKPAKTYLTR